MNNLISINEAEALMLCKKCNFAGRKKREKKPCNYHMHPSLNYRNIPSGMCALRLEDRDRMFDDYGKDRSGKLVIK